MLSTLIQQPTRSVKDGFLIAGTILAVTRGPVLGLWGAPSGSEMGTDALAFLQVKALGAPVTVLLLVLQVSFSPARCSVHTEGAWLKEHALLAEIHALS